MHTHTSTHVPTRTHIPMVKSSRIVCPLRAKIEEQIILCVLRLPSEGVRTHTHRTCNTALFRHNGAGAMSTEIHLHTAPAVRRSPGFFARRMVRSVGHHSAKIEHLARSTSGVWKKSLVCTNAKTNTHASTRKHTEVNMNMNMRAHTRMNACTNTRANVVQRRLPNIAMTRIMTFHSFNTRTSTRTRTHTCTQAPARTHACTHKHARTHARTQNEARTHARTHLKEPVHILYMIAV